MARKKSSHKVSDQRTPFNPSRFVPKATEFSAMFQHAKQLGTDIYVGFVPLNILCSAAYVDVIDPNSKKFSGCQRGINTSRIGRIASEFDARRAAMLDPVLINAPRNAVKIEETRDGDSTKRIMFQVDPSNRILVLTDGQHRLAGMAASKAVSDDELVPVTMTIGVDNIRLRRIVSDFGSTPVRLSKSLQYDIGASIYLHDDGKNGLINTNSAKEVRKCKAAAAIEYMRSQISSPLHDRVTIHDREVDGRIPMARLVDFLDWTLRKSPKLNSFDAMELSFVLIDFFRTMRLLVGDEFSSGVMLSAKALKVQSRLLWHVAEELIDETDDGYCYRGMEKGNFAVDDERYEQVLRLLRPLEAWQRQEVLPDGTTEGSVWYRCHTDKTSGIDTWYALMLVALGWTDKPSCVPGVKAQLQSIQMVRGREMAAS